MADPVKEREGFDVIVHLLGEQRLPVCLGIRQFKCPRHIVVHSGVPEEVRDSLLRVVGADVRIEGVRVHPYDPHESREKILSALGNISGRAVAFNLTGGTKLMFAGASAACEHISGKPFYIETLRNELIWLDRDFTRTPIIQIRSVEPFFLLNGFRILKPGLWDDDPARAARIELTLSLWSHARTLGGRGVYRDIAEFNDKPGQPFHIEGPFIRAELSRTGQASLDIGDIHYRCDRWPDFARYLSGGWFEEFTYLQLKPLLESQRIRDLRIGLKIDWQTPVQNSGTFGAQEFDVAFTDGHRLTLIECKAGALRTEHVMTLENHVRHYGGVVSIGALATVFPPHPSTRKKIECSSSICGFLGNAMEDKFVKNIVIAEPGQVFSGPIPGGKAPSRPPRHSGAHSRGFRPLENAFRDLGGTR